MSVGERLRTETRDLHTRAEKGPFQAALLAGRLPREHYERNLEQMLLVHRALEARLRASTNDAIRAIVTEEQLEKVSDDLLGLEGMEKSLAATLAQQGIRTRDDLADLAVDELVEMAGIDEERAKALISVARAHWFEE